MARGGINKAVVKKARDALLARRMNPTIDAVRAELGNTGSKTTIHRYLKELGTAEQDPRTVGPRLSDELQNLVAGLLERLLEESGAVVMQAREVFDQQRDDLVHQLEVTQKAVDALQRENDSQEAALAAQSGELQTTLSSLQTELTRNARLAQNCSDLEVRVQEKHEQIRSLEEKHQHSRDALEHYRNAVKEQREQDQRRHEGQLQQVQVELRQLQQTQMHKQDELTRLNRDNERLLGEARERTRAATKQEDVNQRLSGEVDDVRRALANAEGARDAMQDQVSQLQDKADLLTQSLAIGKAEAAQLRLAVEHAQAEMAAFQAEKPPAEGS
nr:DNA-binding protein [uncultured Pseudomonas sp.]